MEQLGKIRASKGLSQRGLASLAGISYKTLQLIESGAHDPKVSTLEAIAKSLGLPAHLVRKAVHDVLSLPEDAIAVISERIVEDGEESWKLWLFNFVDAFRSKRDRSLIEMPPCEGLTPNIKALLASSVDTLCTDLQMEAPNWCATVPPLDRPWFVSGLESLKPMALIESPVHFRKRNIFVLGNFLSRG